MEPTSRDSYENADTGEHGEWVSIRISRRDDDVGFERRRAMIDWANAELGDEFFCVGSKFYFSKEQHLILFNLVWA